MNRVWLSFIAVLFSASIAVAQTIVPQGCSIALGIINCGNSSISPVTGPTGAVSTIQYNNAGAFGGIAHWTTDGINTLTGGIVTSIAVGGAVIGTNTLAVFGTSNLNGNVAGTTMALGTCSIGSFTLCIAGPISLTSLSLGGATIGSNALAVTGTSAFSNLLTVTNGSASDFSGLDIINTTSGWGNSINFKNSAEGNNAPTLASILAEPNSTGAIFQINVANLSKALNTSLEIENDGQVRIAQNLTIGGSANAILTGVNTATLQFGAANSATPIAQTLQFQNGVGTNIAAVNATFKCPMGTGTGTNGDCLFYSGTKTISGTTAATPTLVLKITGETQLVEGVIGFAAKGVTGVVSCTVVALGATITITGGIITAITGC